MSTSETGDTRVRLLRILEYTFRDQEAMDNHLGMMTVPLQGTYTPAGSTPHVKIRSTAFYPSGEHQSLFTVEDGAPPKIRGKILVVTDKTWSAATERAQALAKQAGHFEYAVIQLDVRGGNFDPPEGYGAVIVELDQSHPAWPRIRSACYSARVEMFSPEQFIARQRGGL